MRLNMLKPGPARENAFDDERALLRGARSLDEAALSVIFDTFYPRLYRYMYHHLRHQATAEDLAAEVFTRMLERLAEGRGPKRHLKAWLYRVAHNLVIDESRRRVHRDHEQLDERKISSEQNIEMQVQRAILQQKAHAALRALTPKQRAVLILTVLEGYAVQEVALILKMSVGAVKSLRHRGLAAMRRRLAQQGSIADT
jgi:RNA polymerase sigma-70 factor (ECF subfamily)